MEENKVSTKLLEEISASLKEINARQETEEVFQESNKLMEKVEDRVQHSTQQIQNSFDRIHDKVFNFNNIMIGAYLVLGTFPTDSPILPLWSIIFPIIILIYLVIIEIRQMEIHRFASNEKNWTEADRNKFGKKIDSQTMMSLIALVLTVCCFGYIIFALAG
ncbi:hypothetical protein K6119_00635 [Paracrocinitomix mangrovi]|uniref:hypothetical protein n=1 Tax=Paracrocinitomix mangrovi TaxID=2862509 RepID=UPI001C8D3EDC|nr:hypothetical protein [Paracrocinitomix mangrovi]UKN02021.1 hypothetical protein K6119_00635 [Paracrocinitomix mangrovi]